MVMCCRELDAYVKGRGYSKFDKYLYFITLDYRINIRGLKTAFDVWVEINSV
jgi:hypothetical protein